MNLLKEINSFEDITFKTHPHDPTGVKALVDLGDSELSIIGGDSFYGDGKVSFEVAFIDKTTGRVSAPAKFIDEKKYPIGILEGFEHLDIFEEEVIPYASKKKIEELILLLKQKSLNSDDDKKQASFKKISDKLLELAFLDKEERKKGLIDLQADLDMTDEKTKLVADILLGISAEGEKPKKIETKTKVKTKTKPQIENFESLMEEELDFCSLIDDCLLD